MNSQGHSNNEQKTDHEFQVDVSKVSVLTVSSYQQPNGQYVSRVRGEPLPPSHPNPFLPSLIISNSRNPNVASHPNRFRPNLIVSNSPSLISHLSRPIHPPGFSSHRTDVPFVPPPSLSAYSSFSSQRNPSPFVPSPSLTSHSSKSIPRNHFFPSRPNYNRPPRPIANPSFPSVVPGDSVLSRPPPLPTSRSANSNSKRVERERRRKVRDGWIREFHAELLKIEVFHSPPPFPFPSLSPRPKRKP